MSEGNGGDMRVTYTVKEILGQMDIRADERHREMLREVEGLKSRVGSLEGDKARMEGAVDQKARMYAAILALVTLIINAPAAWAAISGGGGGPR